MKEAEVDSQGNEWSDMDIEQNGLKNKKKKTIKKLSRTD